jgi:hypothetical protein
MNTVQIFSMYDIPVTGLVSKQDKIYVFYVNMQCFVFRIEFLIIPAVALALLINHEFTVLEVRSKYTYTCDRGIYQR